jgi:DNA-directed RNA polymerase subunit E"
MSLRACRECNTITDEKICPNCRSSDLSEDFSGILIIINPDGSRIAEKAGLKREGVYALKVR